MPGLRRQKILAWFTHGDLSMPECEKRHEYS